MTYKYKESIKNAVNEMYSASFVDEENRKNELDYVYAQASKADEYEAKARAFDEIMREWENERITKSHILETIQKYYNKYESGELDA